MHRGAVSTLLAALASCATPPDPAPPLVTTPAPRPAPTPIATATPVPSSRAATNADGGHEVALELRRGDRPCTLVFEGALFKDHADWFVISQVSRIATQAGGACTAATLFDLDAEKKAARNDEEPEALEAGAFQKPHRPAAADIADAWNVIQDLDFDGFADLCVVALTGAYNYSQKCWLFDPAKRTFRRERDLDEVIFMKLDATQKKLRSDVRVGGPVYADRRYAWEKGKLVMVAQEVTTLGERPDGKPLPPGFSRWVARYERRGAELVKISEGPEKESQRK